MMSRFHLFFLFRLQVHHLERIIFFLLLSFFCCAGPHAIHYLAGKSDQSQNAIYSLIDYIIFRRYILSKYLFYRHIAHGCPCVHIYRLNYDLVPKLFPFP